MFRLLGVVLSSFKSLFNKVPVFYLCPSAFAVAHTEADSYVVKNDVEQYLENTPGYSALLQAPEFQALLSPQKDDVDLTCSDLGSSEAWNGIFSSVPQVWFL